MVRVRASRRLVSAVKLTFISALVFEISQLQSAQDRVVSLARTQSSFAANTMNSWRCETPGPKLLRSIWAESARKFITNFEGPYPHSIDRQGRKYCAGKILTAWACMPGTRCALCPLNIHQCVWHVGYSGLAALKFLSELGLHRKKSILPAYIRSTRGAQ